MGLLYSASRFLLNGLVRVASSWEVRGLENVPRTGGLIVASNHISFYDPPLIGIAAGGGVLWAIAAGYEKIRKQEGMGFGDVKLLAMVGGFQGWEASLFSLIIGSILGTIVGVSLMIARRGRLDMEIPFGPFIIAGAVLHMLGGPKIISWYLG